MKKIWSGVIILLALLIACPAAESAQPKKKAKARSGAVKRSSAQTITWIDDIPSPRSLVYAWEHNAVGNAFNQLCNALYARGYYNDDYDIYSTYYKPGVARIFFDGGRFESDVFVSIPDRELRQRYYEAAKKAYGSNREFSVEIEDDQVQIYHMYQ